MHLDYADEGSRAWLEEVLGLDEVTAEALVSPDPRPRSVVVGEGLLVVLRGINVNDGADPEDMVSLRMWLEADRAVTLRHRKLMAVQDTVTALREGHGPVDIGDLLHSVVDRLLDRIGAVVDALEDDADDLEEQVLTAESRALRSRLADLRRRAISLRRCIGPQRDTLGRLHGERVAWLDDMRRARLRESADRATR